MDIRLRVLYQELTEEQFNNIRNLTKDSIGRNGIEVWFETKEGITDQDIETLCTQNDLVRIS